MTGFGRVYTPPSLATALVQRTIPPDVTSRARAVSICDPACGDGALLAAAAQAFPKARLFGFDIDPDAVVAARARLPQAAIEQADSLADFSTGAIRGEAAFDFVIANPPWVSFSGRHAQPLVATRRDVLQRYETFALWPTLHGPFVELSLRLARERVGILLPRQVCELERYAPLREHMQRHAQLVDPVLEFGEDSFPGVIQPTCGLVLAVRERMAMERSGAAPDANVRAGAAFGHRAKLPEALTSRPNLAAELFLDIGIHSGNCARKLFDRGGDPVREGRDVVAYAVHAPRRTFARPAGLAATEYFRAKDRATYESIPILIRQTASRPIAALHREPTYFRNSILACRAPDGVAPELLVAWLNSTAVAWYHRTRVAESGQRVFPQVKVRHLRDLPAPDWHAVPAPLAARARDVCRGGASALAVTELDRMVWAWLGLADAAWAATRQQIDARSVPARDLPDRSTHA